MDIAIGKIHCMDPVKYVPHGHTHEIETTLGISCWL